MRGACSYRGVSKKKGKWEAKVMVNRKWVYRQLFENEKEAALAYDREVRKRKPAVANSFVNFSEKGDLIPRDEDGKVKSALKEKRPPLAKAPKQQAVSSAW